MGRFKAGDRVKILAGHPYHDVGGEGVYVGKANSNYRGKHNVLVTYEDGDTSELAFKGRELELLADSATAPIVIEAGEFYCSRNGRKAGAMVAGVGITEWPFEATVDGKMFAFGTRCAWRSDGSFDPKDVKNPHPLDLIAEWVDEPTAPVEPKPALKIGDRVRIVNHDRNPGQDTGEWKDLPIGSEHTITSKSRDGEDWILSGSKLHFWTDIQLEVVALPKGALVSLTTTGKVSGVGGNGNINIVFPDLPTGRNSFALPALILAVA